MNELERNVKTLTSAVELVHELFGPRIVEGLLLLHLIQQASTNDGNIRTSEQTSGEKTDESSRVMKITFVQLEENLKNLQHAMISCFTIVGEEHEWPRHPMKTYLKEKVTMDVKTIRKSLQHLQNTGFIDFKEQEVPGSQENAELTITLNEKSLAWQRFLEQVDVLLGEQVRKTFKCEAVESPLQRECVALMHLNSGLRGQYHTDLKFKILLMLYFDKLSGKEWAASSNTIKALQRIHPTILNIHIYAFEDALAHPFPLAEVEHGGHGSKRYVRCTDLGKKFMEALYQLGKALFKDVVFTPAGTCPQCSDPIQPSWKICPHCGTPLHVKPLTCPHCGEEVEKDWRFCPSCRESLSSREEALRF